MQRPQLPIGFRAAGCACGIKDPSAFDLALFVSDVPSAGAGVFTQNLVCGAPVKVSRERVPRGTARAVIINSGNANACTGPRGIEDARWMTQSVADRLRCDAADVLVCSTGVIGRPLPRGRIEAGIPGLVEQLSASPEAFENAARGMMTTDTVIKLADHAATIAGKHVTVSGAAKGAAMIGPNLATMLCVLMTDAELSGADADAILRRCVDHSFNCISVEGHTSTSDSVLLLANGSAATGPLPQSEKGVLESVIGRVADELARAIVADAEGAQHLIQIDVRGLRTADEAAQIARTVAGDVLVKTAIAGADPNWGRVVSAAGRAGVQLTEEDITLSINGTLIYKQGAPVPFDESAVARELGRNRNVVLELSFQLGDAETQFWTSDLTAEYVRLNSEYTT